MTGFGHLGQAAIFRKEGRLIRLLDQQNGRTVHDETASLQIVPTRNVFLNVF